MLTVQGKQDIKICTAIKTESAWFKTRLIFQFLTLSFLLTQPFYIPYLHAAPTGGEIVGGTGTIDQADLITTINQTSQNLVVNWESFNVEKSEVVNFSQPNTSAIALNRINGNNGRSIINGQIYSDGQVILVNTSGILFTSTAKINVGGLVASSLDMTPSDFMNGNYIFNEVIGTDGAVINSGIINASTGGNVALLGKQVKNEGLISANLGSVVLAAGKESVLTFDNQGLLGIKVTKEVLQEEIGVEEAVINRGDIKASGGRVLLTASTSQDVFSQAVNTEQLEQAKSVVVHEDGSFTLGGGADVLNTGSIDVSSKTNSENGARIVLLGENITSSGQITADTIDGQAGEIEIHANDKTLLTENSFTSAQALATGQGGIIKVLGDKVGLFETSHVNASGANGGGEVLIGGDRQGLNADIRNASFIYLGEMTAINADATVNGNGGKIITFAEDTARIHGGLYARGGAIAGNGGFIETSGLKGFEITNAPDVSSFNGNGGLWLIDPYNITIVNTSDCGATYTCTTLGEPFTPSSNDTYLDVGLVQNALNGGDVEVNTGSTGDGGSQSGNIIFEADLDFNSAGNDNRLLTLKANNDITFTSTASITDSDRSNGGTDPRLDLDIEADSDSNGLGNVSISTNSTGINLFGGTLDIVNAQNVNFNSGVINTFNTGATVGGGNLVVSQAAAVTFNGATINTSAGDIDIQNSSGVAFNGGTTSTNGGLFQLSTTGDVTSDSSATNSITTSGGDFIVNSAVDFDSSYASINVGTGSVDLDGSGSGVVGDVVLGNLIASGRNSDLYIRNATSISQLTDTSILINNISDLNVISGGGQHSIILQNSGNKFENIKLQGSDVKIFNSQSLNILGGTNVTSLLEVTSAGNIEDLGNIVVSNIDNNAVAIFDAAMTTEPYGNVLLNNNNNFNNVKILNANNVVINDITGSVALEANNGANSGGIFGDLTLTTTDTTTTLDGNITDMGGVLIPLGGGATYTGEINVAGTATFNIATDRSLIFDNTDNSFGGLVTFNNYNHGAPEISDITFYNSSALTLSDIYVSGDLDVRGERIKFGHLGVQGSLSATTTGIPTATDTLAGSIIQTTGEHLYVALDTDLNASGDITLEDVDNDFNNLTVLNGEVVSIYDSDEIRLISSNTNNDLSIQANGDISLVGDITTNTNAALESADVTFTGNIRLDTPTDGGTVTIDTTASNGVVTFAGNINNIDSNMPRNNLEINTGNGNIDIQGGIGVENTNPRYIGSLIINKDITSTAIVNINDIHTRSNTADTTSAIDVTASTIYLSGDISTNGISNYGRGVTLNGNVVLSDDVSIDTSGDISDGNISITGNVITDGTARDLIIFSETGDVSLSNIGSNTHALSSLSINSGATDTAGTVNVGSIVTQGGNGNGIDISGQSITLNDNVSSNSDGQGGDITFNGQVTLANDITINTVGSGGNGHVSFNALGSLSGGINSDTTAARTLTVNADDKNISVSGNIGNINPLQKVIFNTTGSVSVNDITTIDSRSISNNDTGVSLTGSTIYLGGNITSNTVTGSGADSGSVTFDGDVILLNDVVVDTYLAGSTPGGAINFTGQVNADSANNNRSLTIDSGAASTTISANIGSSDALQSFTVSSADTTNIQQVFTRSDGIDITSNTINLYGDLDTKDTSNAGQVSLVGNVYLFADTTFDTDGSSSDASIFIDGSVNNASPRNLRLNAGSADVTMTGTAGSITALSRLTITGNNVVLGQVNASNEIDIDGANSIDLSGDLTSSAGFIHLQNGDVTLLNDITLSTSGTNLITVDGTINANDAANDYLFTVSADFGDVMLSGDIGQVQAIEGLNITTSGTASIQNVNTRSGGVLISSDTLNLDGNIDTTLDASNAGAVNLSQDTLNFVSNTVINTNSASGIDNDISIIDTLISEFDVNGNSLSLNAGNGDVSVNTLLTNLAGFSVGNSQSASLAGIETNNGLISVNANTDISLAGNYSSGSADMIFSADSDLNNSGLLNLTNTSTFSGENISYSGASLTPNAVSINANNTVTFNNTVTQVVLGDVFSGTYHLSNAFLDKVNASAMQVNADNSYVMLNNAVLDDNSYLLDLDARDIYSYTADSQLNNLNATASSRIYLYKNITSTGDIVLNASDIYSYNYTATAGTEVSSTSGNIRITGNIAGFYDLSLNAVNGEVLLQGDTNSSLISDFNINANTISHGNVTATSNLNFVSGGAYIQSGNLESTNGDISIYATSGDIGLAYNKTDSGSISVTAANGGITDNNGNSPGINIETGGTINLSATNGIGHNDPLEIISLGQNTSLNAVNTGSGNIEISNTGTILLDNISNTQAGNEFYIQNNGTITVNSIVLDKSNDLSVATFDVTNGDVLGVQGNTKHLTANSAIFNMNNTGSIGALGASFITDVPNKIEVISSLSTYIEYYGQVPPKEFIGDNAYKNRALQAIESLSGQQLIELESLAEIDPAIFTDVRNYSHSDIALMMPSDQRYDLSDEEEEDEEAKEKRYKLIHSQNL